MASSTSREGVQAIRLARKNKTVDITTHKDNTTGQEVVLWSDIIMVFRDALYLQYGSKAIPFLKGQDFKTLDPLRIAAVPGATLEVVVDDDSDDESSTGVNLRFVSSRAEKSKSKSKSTRPPAQKSRGPTHSAVPQTPISQPTSIQTTRSAAPQALPLEGTSLTTSFEPKSTSTRPTPIAPQGSFFTSLLSMTTPEVPIVRHQRTPRGTCTTAYEASTIESLAGTTNSHEIPNDQNYAAPRNPQYGLVEQALENYNHIEVPPESLRALQPDSHKNDARNPQCESDTPIDTQLLNRTNQARAPQEYHAIASYNDFTQMIEWAEKGDVESQVALRDMYRTGNGVREDHYVAHVAHNWFLQAAEQGYALAQYSVGFMCRYQEVFGMDKAMVEMYFRKAANQGVMEAQYEMGRLYQEGFDRIKQDPDEAMTWYLKAAEQDYAPAKVAIGSLHESGQCGRIPEKDRNYSGAMEWYLKAATQGDAQAHYEIGRMFDEGAGVVQDDLKARQWYAQAAGRGHADAKKRLPNLGSESRHQVEPSPGTLRGFFGRLSEAFF
ncbi:hypothetical protein BGZ96_011310 [Linnemannia gamsii]|uniref:HCP-like protein n=1 Tax=Linnemannia gamsii TaxID=64522 RepID=A0ABQ7JSP1_9FUNG|nr:hypothetical protein BGZ96_011310 [Linnemannia gamsii]